MVCQIVPTVCGTTKVNLVDCPGFDDKTRSDAEILHIIGSVLSVQYLQGVKLWGVIYLQKITDNRFAGSTRQALELFQQLVGEEALGNVVLATTQWSKVRLEDKTTALERQQELRTKYWSEMLEKGAQIFQFEGDQASAESIVAQLIGKQHVVFRIQQELVEEQKRLGQTGAGALVEPIVKKKLEESKSDLQKVREKQRLNPSNFKKQQLAEQEEDAKNRVSQGEADAEKLGSKLGVKIMNALKNIDWKKAMKTAYSVVAAGMTIALALNGIFVSFPNLDI